MEDLVLHMKIVPTLLKDAERELLQLQRIKRENDTLKDKVRMLQSSPKRSPRSARVNCSPSDKELRSLQKENETLQKEFNRLQVSPQYPHTSPRVASSPAAKQIASLKKQLKDEAIRSEATIERATEEIMKLSQGKEKLQTDCDRLMQENEKLTQDKEKVQRDYDALIKDVEKQIELKAKSPKRLNSAMQSIGGKRTKEKMAFPDEQKSAKRSESQRLRPVNKTQLSDMSTRSKHRDHTPSRNNNQTIIIENAEELAHLKKEIHALNSEISTLQRYNEDEQGNLENVVSELNLKLKQANETIQQERKRYEDEQKQCLADHEALLERNGVLEYRIDELKRLIEQNRGVLSEHQSELQHANEERKRNVKEREAFINEIKALSEQNVELKTQIVKLKRKVEQKDQTSSDFMYKQQNTVQQEREKHSNEQTRLKEKYEALRKQNESLQEQVRQNKRTNTQNDQILSELEAELINKTAEIESLQMDIQRKGAISGDAELKAQLSEVSKELQETKRELDDTKTRLSKLMGQKLTDNNPNIADLSDKNRPTKLAERYTELYDNQWTDAFEELDNDNEEETIDLLNAILTDTMEYCRSMADRQMQKLKTAITLSTGTSDASVPVITNKQLKDCRKAIAELSSKHLLKRYTTDLKKRRDATAKAALNVPSYTKECLEVSWFMSIQDPPVFIDSSLQPGDKFATDIYKAYTTSGPQVDYLVWPALYLHHGGPLLCKGVAQGCGTNVTSRR